MLEEIELYDRIIYSYYKRLIQGCFVKGMNDAKEVHWSVALRLPCLWKQWVYGIKNVRESDYPAAIEPHSPNSSGYGQFVRRGRPG